MRRTISSGRPTEAAYGYSRAVVVDRFCFVSGTTSLNPAGEVEGKGDAYTQARRTLENIRSALEQAGFSMKDVVRTVAYVTDISLAGEVARAHREFLGDVRPAATLVQVSALIHPDMLVEIEATAVKEA